MGTPNDPLGLNPQIAKLLESLARIAASEERIAHAIERIENNLLLHVSLLQKERNL